MDEVGTPFCVKFDFDSLEDNSVTVRESDSLEQIRVSVDILVDVMSDLMKKGWQTVT